MADNFNLRSFLTENKLTKNAQLLKEGSDYGYEAVIDAIADHFEEGTPEYDQVLTAVEDAFHSNEVDTSDFSHDPSAPGKVVLGIAKGLGLDEAKEETTNEARYSDSYDTPAAKAVNAKAEQIVGTIRGYKTALQTIQDAIKQVEQEVGSEATRSEKSTLENHLMHMFRSEMEMERESVDNKKPVMENLTAKERRLVEMVQNALGITEEEHEFGTNAVTGEPLPDPKSQMVAEDEMVQENPLPKYKNIDELMSNIEHGTNEAAHKYKMERMKEVAEALEAKVSSLEEGENAEHIDQKAVKQMRKDILALRKGEEKLRKEFEKKFAAKKEKKEDK
ncbi:cob(I)alamin adenosyltransferase [Flavobacterium phage vB_FspM_immuto_3-5A]|uniref:Cob(I)alamin adenosyltransferase n=1 Tax=Flavobacterium phage vB_FspM_immuto_2-6A TaxID=2801477 RepID=A0A7T8ERI2_9CAUD|nr:cob(I)alamin adenosyltransferase [Flavobacterium phage vB_FspM_immuto_2-6A]QQO91873.1 cob(I)alamin adenosyltransferase [Flavobacterium phage vB_FspM_immuto_2-6A]QQO92111.1 cob(I)alamin adenosyltransferase [Flavobacterium phage vB_FspM_immuto_3-5A]QQO92349.1 cob(I)alamin adenosyltransferase [Flavobacterium phage vB_FspM_immuto_13-6C]